MAVVRIPDPDQHLLDAAKPEQRLKSAISAREVIADDMLVIKEPCLELADVPVVAPAPVEASRNVGAPPHHGGRVEDELLALPPLLGKLDRERLLLVHRNALVPSTDAQNE